MNKSLLIVPDERLRQVCKPLNDSCSGYTKELVKYMLAQLKPLNAIGFAAPQFGEMVRVFVGRVPGVEIVMVNPELVKTQGTHWVQESCKSIPGEVFSVQRPKVVKVRGVNLYGVVRAVKGHGLLAQLLMHEMNHLDGVLIDSIARL